MKTLSDLNAKWWYRLLKITYYVGIFLATAVILPLVFFSYQSHYDAHKSYAICKSGTKINLYDNAGIDYTGGFISFSDVRKINALCLSDLDLGTIAKEAFPNAISQTGIKYADIDTETLGKLARAASSDSLSNLEVSPSTLDRLVVGYDPRNWLATIGYSFLALGLVGIVFEFIRRCFYYVVLGKLRPQKT